MKEQMFDNNAFFVENVSLTDFETTMASLMKAIENRNWKVSGIQNLQDSLKKNGDDVLPVRVISFCNPNYSGRILKNDNERIISSMMPCRVSVYEKKDGKTYVSRMNPKTIAAKLGGIVEQVMTESAEEVESVINDVIQPRKKK